jgi:glycosyltransferase involved in cell wall biosynthesis
MYIAIIVTSYNDADSILKCLNSIKLFKKRLQKFNTRIILVDDASTDNTPEILVEFSREVALTYFKKYKTNKGVSRSRNYGISKSLDADYTMFVDGDDEINLKLADYLNKSKLGNDLYTFDFSIVRNKKEIQHNHQENGIVFNDKSISEYLFSYLITPNRKSMFVACWAKLYKTKILKNNVKLRFKEEMKVNEDAHFVFSFLRKSKIIEYVNISAYKYNDNSKLTHRASFAIDSHVVKFFSIILALRQLRFYLIEKNHNIDYVNSKIFHCIAAYTCIYSNRSWVRARSFSDILTLFYDLKKIYKKPIIKKSIKLYDVNKAKGGKFLSFFLKREFFFISAIISFIQSIKRY